MAEKSFSKLFFPLPCHTGRGIVLRPMSKRFPQILPAHGITYGIRNTLAAFHRQPYSKRQSGKVLLSGRSKDFQRQCEMHCFFFFYSAFARVSSTLSSLSTPERVSLSEAKVFSDFFGSARSCGCAVLQKIFLSPYRLRAYFPQKPCRA